MASVGFTAAEYQADGGVCATPYAFEGSETDGWDVRRDGAAHVRLGPGYRLVRVSHCGVCATDLARRHLPFPLPQVIGHEVVALDDDGAPIVVEINASHAARGVAAPCAYCARGLASHCPERLVLGIHDLPGGFGRWILAPRHAVRPLPAGVSPRAATFVEPFAAALHAVRIVTRRPRRRIAVLGPRRLGMLVVAALAAWRRRTGAAYEIVALARRPELRALARRLGADEARDPTACPRGAADVVVDTTGGADGFTAALDLAREEVHLKSTCGAPSGGLVHATAMVVDELALAPPNALAPPPAGGPPYETALAPRDVRPPGGLRRVEPAALDATPFGAADVVVARSIADVDDAIRPRPDVERGLVRPRGTILLADGDVREPLVAAVRERGLVVTTSRCGDFDAALDLLPDVADLAGALLTAAVPAGRLADALAMAAAPEHVKVVVTHPDGVF